MILGKSSPKLIGCSCLLLLLCKSTSTWTKLENDCFKFFMGYGLYWLLEYDSRPGLGVVADFCLFVNRVPLGQN